VARFRLWAPSAARAEVDLAGGRIEMARDGDRGWWTVDVPSAVSGTEYRFAVDGGDALPDPRSASQPKGIHGPSMVVDHAAFGWTDQQWRGVHLRSAVLYELHVGTFTPDGTFDGVIAKLDHLVDLGVTAIELLPVAEFSGDRGWGYDGVDLYAPHAAYGGPDGLKRLVDACHRRGIGVVIDVVYNHLGPAGNYLGVFGPYFTDRYLTPWGDAVNLDGAWSGGVRDFFVDNAVMWLRDYHCDGLRLDAVHALMDRSARHFLEELADRVASLGAEVGRPLFLIAESDLNDPRIVRPPMAGGYGLDASWSDEFHHALHAWLTGEVSGYYEDFGSVAHVAKAMGSAYVYDGGWSVHRKRAHGRPPDGLRGWSFVVFAQNHDQVGNRAVGERIAALTSVGRTKIAAALYLLSPYVPMLFMGEEWAASAPFQYFTAHDDEELGRAVSEGRRREFAYFGWDPTKVPDPQDPATFERSKLGWDETSAAPHDGMLRWYADLIGLRRSRAELIDGDRAAVRTRFDETAGWLMVERGPVTIACNAGADDVRLPVADRPHGVLLASEAGAGVVGHDVVLPPDSVVVLG
jgi:maltooligosyltrehalose trehalohydrolase